MTLTCGRCKVDKQLNLQKLCEELKVCQERLENPVPSKHKYKAFEYRQKLQEKLETTIHQLETLKNGTEE